MGRDGPDQEHRPGRREREQGRPPGRPTDRSGGELVAGDHRQEEELEQGRRGHVRVEEGLEVRDLGADEAEDRHRGERPRPRARPLRSGHGKEKEARTQHADGREPPDREQEPLYDHLGGRSREAPERGPRDRCEERQPPRITHRVTHYRPSGRRGRGWILPQTGSREGARLPGSTAGPTRPLPRDFRTHGHPPTRTQRSTHPVSALGRPGPRACGLGFENG